MMYLQRFRATSSTVLRLNAGALTLRAAFSHIPFWQTANDAVNRVVLQVVLGAQPPLLHCTAACPAIPRCCLGLSVRVRSSLCVCSVCALSFSGSGMPWLGDALVGGDADSGLVACQLWQSAVECSGGYVGHTVGAKCLQNRAAGLLGCTAIAAPHVYLSGPAWTFGWGLGPCLLPCRHGRAAALRSPCSQLLTGRSLVVLQTAGGPGMFPNPAPSESEAGAKAGQAADAQAKPVSRRQLGIRECQADPFNALGGPARPLAPALDRAALGSAALHAPLAAGPPLGVKPPGFWWGGGVFGGWSGYHAGLWQGHGWTMAKQQAKTRAAISGREIVHPRPAACITLIPLPPGHSRWPK
jgi:hypothetical protein